MFTRKSSFRFLQFALLCAFVVAFTQYSWPVTAQETPASHEKPALSFQPSAEADALTELFPPTAVVVGHSKQADSLTTTPTAQNIQIAPQDTAVYLSPELVVYVEGQTFKEATQLVISQVTPADVVEASRPLTPTVGLSPQSTTLYAFELEAISSSTSEKGISSTTLATFEKPVRVMLDLRQYGYDLRQDGGEFYVAYEDPENPGVFKGVSVTTYQPDGLISIETDHFSNWEAGWRPTSWNLTWQPPVTSEFTGSANYSYPFDVPPGRNGLQPSLALSYSSGGIQGAVKQTSHGYVASGWSLSQTNIVRDGNNFHLTLNGTGYRLFNKDANHVNGRMQFYLENGPSLRVYNYNGWEMTDCTYWTVETADGTLYRLGYAPTQCNALQNNAISYISKQQLGEPSATNYTSAWHVDTITDVFGNQIQFNYDRPHHTDNTGLFWCPGGGGICQLTTINYASRLTFIQYNFENRVTSSSYPFPSTVARVTGNYASEIGFEYGYGIGNEVSYLSAVNIYHGGSTTTPVANRRYEIVAENIDIPNSEECRLFNSDGTTSNPDVTTRIVNSIQLKVQDELNPIIWRSLPATTFGYITLPHWEIGTGDCFNYKHLDEVSNGYGARVRFTYTPDYMRGTFTTCRDQKNCSIAYPPVGLNYRVMHMWSTDGYDEEGGNNDWVLTHYLYGTACYDQVLNSWGELMCPQPLTTATTGNIAGHQSVTVTVFDAGALYASNLRPIHRSITTYNVLDMQGNTSVYFGRPILQTSGIPDGNGISATQKQETHHLVYVHSIYATAADGQGVSFVYEKETITRQYSGSTTPITSKVVYDYATANQKNNLGTATQYGKLTETKEYASEGASTPFRSTRYWYQGNTTSTSWLIVPSAQWTYANGNGNILNGSWYYYDGATTSVAENTPPAITKGVVTRTRALTPVTPATDCTLGCTSIDQVMSYDVYGNVSTTTSYPAYGLVTNSSGTSYFPSTSGAQTTTLNYDPQFNLYPIKVTDPAGSVTKFEVYGFKNEAGTLINLGGFNKQAGLLSKVIGANDVKSWYEYDLFGRLFATYETGYADTSTPAGYGTIDPLDGTPEVRYAYFDTDWYQNHGFGSVQLNPAANQPFPITTYSQPGNMGSYNFVQTAYHDGYGRVIQAQDLNLTTDGISGLSRRIVNTAYDAMGQAYCQSAPYSIPNGAGFQATNCVSSAHTKTIAQYTLNSGLTGLGDSKMIAPDGSISLSTNQIVTNITVGSDSLLSQTTVTDAKNNQLAQFANSKGQMVLVREFNGATSYADTQYGYDLAGNLTSVTRREPNNSGNGTLLAPVSTISYDGFGRKTGMVDPDMGSWSYRYDALGNLLEQTDAQAQHLCFYYDNLNRLQTKSYTLNSNCPASAPSQSNIFWLASYNYNNGGSGHGQISKVSWTPDPTSNFESLTYDTFARVSSHTRRIDGFDYTMQTLLFDAFNRPLQIRYPDGNVVTMTYDREGVNTLAVTGVSGNLVNKMNYNSLGQLSFIDRNISSVPNTTYNYYPATDASGGGLGDSNFRLASIAHGSTTYGYEYDQVGNITKLTETGQTALNFSYDTLNRLTAVTGGFSESYDYNKLGNLTTFGSYTQAYSTSKPHALVSQAGGPYGASTFAYDANGNMTQRDNATGTDYLQAFDQENRLTNVIPSTTTASDSFGSLNSTLWNFSGHQTISSGTLQNVGTGGATYAAQMSRKATLPATGVSASVDFKLSSNTVGAHFTLDSEDGWDPNGINFDRIALIANTSVSYFRFNYYDNSNIAQNYDVPFAPQVNVWYRVTLTVDDEMGHTINVTKRDDATVQATFRVPAGVLDKDKNWKFWHFTDTGTIHLDNYKEYTAATSFAYDPSGQRTLTMEPGRATTAFPFVGYEAERRLATQQVTFGNLGYGIDCNDNASSSGYIMYSEESVFTRFSANPPAANNAQNFVCVRYAAGVWSYHTGGSSNVLVPFPTRPTDVLIASVNYSTDTFTLLENQTGTYGGLSKGYSNHNITLVAKQWNGSPDTHNFQITVGSYFYRNFTLIQRSTYSLDGTPIATRVSGDTVSGNNGLFYLFTDHLGSSAFMTTSTGTVVSGSTARYKPFGGYRTTPSQTITDRGFTGHLHNDSVGLVYMNARFYLPGVGRFASADTIVPEPGNPQAFNRYSYVYNNPLIANDPTGHYVNVVYDEVNQVIRVTTAIEIYQYSGNLMSQRQLEALALAWESSIETEWNGFAYDGVPVIVDVTVFVSTLQGECSTSANCIGVAQYNSSENVYDTGICDRSCVYPGGDSGVWDTKLLWTAAHEFGHLAYLPDDYSESFWGGGTTASPGHETHMMADYKGKVAQHEIDDLINENMSWEDQVRRINQQNLNKQKQNKDIPPSYPQYD